MTLGKWIAEAKIAVSSDTPRKITGPGGVKYSPSPIGASGETAFVFPGSGNHYIGMGRSTGTTWPEILRKMDEDTEQLKTQILPGCYVPWRTSWETGWEKKAREKLISDPLFMIFGQVAHGGLAAGLVKHFSIKPDAVIGYSLGETAGLFAMGAWPERGAMLKRMENSSLFRTELAGPCNAARKVWNVPAEEDVDWQVAVVNRPANKVKHIIQNFPAAFLLIVNSPEECVIGGRGKQIEGVIKRLGCDSFFLDGVITVHCNAIVPVRDAYKKLHVFPTTRPENIRFYSCALGKSRELTTESAATSIINQALSGFDFTETIRRAYKDGVRIFLEMGPHSSCTRMITGTLGDLPHLAISACARGEDDYLTMIKLLGALIAERVPVDLDRLYGDAAYSKQMIESFEKPDRVSETEKMIILPVGGKSFSPALPMKPAFRPKPKPIRKITSEIMPPYPDTGKVDASPPVYKKTDVSDISLVIPDSGLVETMARTIKATSEAHQAFLDFSTDLSKTYEKSFEFQSRLLKTIIASGYKPTDHAEKTPAPMFSRDMCMEFAVGSLATVLGPEFAEVDTYPVRVRLPDTPLMLVDRILTVKGEKGSLGSGRIITEHDVLPDAWYLDGGKTPVCISIEAGQADLFLCSYLGIDLAVKGRRTYRLLDAVATFHGSLPEPGDVIRYEIEIEKFIRQGETYLFFFHFDGFIENTHIISMKNGCAGFFTSEEVKNSGGIILTKEDQQPARGKRAPDWIDPVPVTKQRFDDAAVDALRAGDLEKAFGRYFAGITLTESLQLPGGRMKLIHRILELDPSGGRYGLGRIRAEADIRPDDWFLTCHFVDDMVMPGTLMYECCEHTLRVFMLRMGWITDKKDVCFEPVIGVESILKCRGPVTPETRHVVYEVEISEIGYNPEPYAIADALMYADEDRIVMFRNMSLKISNLTRGEIESFWKNRKSNGLLNEVDNQVNNPAKNQAKDMTQDTDTGNKTPLFDRDHLIEFALGKPSKAFGNKYREFDTHRFIARLPNPPYLLMDRVIKAEPEQWVLKPDGWVEAEVDIHPDDWYFKADRLPVMPTAIIMEIALQPCGWMAAWMGSALKSKNDLKFRNLGGTAVLLKEIVAGETTLTVRTRMTKSSGAGDMIIENYEFQVLEGNDMLYQGDTYFGFFTTESLARQKGITDAEKQAYHPGVDELERGISYTFHDESPLFPGDANADPAPAAAMPAKALRMIDRIEAYVPNGGPNGLGFIRGIKKVDPDEWFFKAHFFQDPVCPGSLGIESFIQLLKFAARQRWGHLAENHRFALVTGKKHSWTYRGQIIQENSRIEVEAAITAVNDEPDPQLFADGYLKVDGIYIYKMENFGIRMVPC